MLHRRLIKIFGFWSVLFVLGCGGSSEPQRHALRGSVVVEGTAVAKGSISFLPSPGNSAPPAHTSIEDGKYRFDKASGPYSGAHRVVIGIMPNPQDESTASADAEQASGQAIKGLADPRVPNRLQKSPEPTKLQWEVEYTIPEDGDDQKDFDLGG